MSPRHRRTRAAMQFSRGLILGRILTGLWHLGMGLCLMSALGLTVSGHFPMAALLMCAAWAASKLPGLVYTLITGRPWCP